MSYKKWELVLRHIPRFFVPIGLVKYAINDQALPSSRTQRSERSVRSRFFRYISPTRNSGALLGAADRSLCSMPLESARKKPDLRREGRRCAAEFDARREDSELLRALQTLVAIAAKAWRLQHSLLPTHKRCRSTPRSPLLSPRRRATVHRTPHFIAAGIRRIYDFRLITFPVTTTIRQRCDHYYHYSYV